MQNNNNNVSTQLNVDDDVSDSPYQVLHDAFFKYQTKPKLTTYGDLYYEGKEFQVKLREMKPGTLSKELKEALGMSVGSPLPWLINTQYGHPLYSGVFGIQQLEQPNYEEELVDYSWGDLEEDEEDEPPMKEEEPVDDIQPIDSLSRMRRENEKMQEKEGKPKIRDSSFRYSVVNESNYC